VPLHCSSHYGRARLLDACSASALAPTWTIPESSRARARPCLRPSGVEDALFLSASAAVPSRLMRQGFAFSFAALLVTIPLAVVARAAEHPALVDGQATNCRSCHTDVFQQRPVLHPPAVDDCSSCHEVSIASGLTRITLVEAMPELCLMCHADLARSLDPGLKVPHPPARDSCLACHDPHAATAEHLLAGPTAEICGA
jgi:predicted CXXCH cytochrome family protein